MNLALALNPPLALRRRRRATVAVVERAPERFNRYLLSVEFESRYGEQWTAIGGGETIDEAIRCAREALPVGAPWAVARWNDLY